MKLVQAGFSETAVLQAFVSESDKTGLAATSETREDLIYLAWGSLESSTEPTEVV